MSEDKITPSPPTSYKKGVFSKRRNDNSLNVSLPADYLEQRHCSTSGLIKDMMKAKEQLWLQNKGELNLTRYYDNAGWTHNKLTQKYFNVYRVPGSAP